MKLNVDGAMGKPKPAGIRDVLHNSDNCLVVFSRNVGILELNEANVLAILEALRFFRPIFFYKWDVENDSENAISCILLLVNSP